MNRRHKREQQDRARWIAHLMNSTGNYKKAITAEQLLGGDQAEKDLTDERLRQRALERRNERLQERRRKEKQSGGDNHTR